MTQTESTSPEAAVVFVPISEGEINPLYVTQCIEHCARRGYTFAGIVRTYKDGLRMLAAGSAQVLVCARRDHIDPRWLPRVEFVGEDTRRLAGRPEPARTEIPTSAPSAGRDRRPRQLRRE